MRLSGSELVTISLLFLLISLAAAQDQYYDDEDQVGSGVGTYVSHLTTLNWELGNWGNLYCKYFTNNNCSID